MSVDRSTIQRANLPFISGSRDGSAYLVKIGGTYYVRSHIVSSAQPIMYANYYKIVRWRNDPYSPAPAIDDLLWQPIEDRRSGEYIVRGAHGTKCYAYIEYSAPAEYIDDYAIACPKVRAGIDTRWNGDRGYWEKYLQSKGWIQA